MDTESISWDSCYSRAGPKAPVLAAQDGVSLDVGPVGMYETLDHTSIRNDHPTSIRKSGLVFSLSHGRLMQSPIPVRDRVILHIRPKQVMLCVNHWSIGASTSKKNSGVLASFLNKQFVFIKETGEGVPLCSVSPQGTSGELFGHVLHFNSPGNS